jgi:hypothetical protein
MEILAQRKELYRKRRPAIVNLMSAFELERFLDHGFVGRKGMPDEVLRKRKALARAEIEHFAHCWSASRSACRSASSPTRSRTPASRFSGSRAARCWR